MYHIKIGCGPITWLTFTAEDVRTSAPATQILQEIADAGYEGIPF